MEANYKQVKKVLRKYFDGDSFTVCGVGDGICNETFRVDYKNDSYILQKLNSALANINLINDFDAISTGLSQFGWDVPLLQKTKDSKNYVKTVNDIWRTYPMINGYTVDELARVDYFSIGEALARFHSNLREINYLPTFVIPHFHDTDYFIKRLKEIKSHIKDGPLQDVASGIILSYDTENNVSYSEVQLIHGDPRIENYLFNKNGRAFSIIDFDTFMRGSIFVDIGDLLRAISLEEKQTVVAFSKDKIRDVLNGYGSVWGKDVKLVSNSLDGMRQITLELCARFLIDFVEDKYFGYDKNKYESRKDNNKARALAQWYLFNKTNENISYFV